MGIGSSRMNAVLYPSGTLNIKFLSQIKISLPFEYPRFSCGKILIVLVYSFNFIKHVRVLTNKMPAEQKMTLLDFYRENGGITIEQIENWSRNYLNIEHELTVVKYSL